MSNPDPLSALICYLFKTERDLEFVTVKEICERAEVSCSTFYLHYRTLGDLLDECMEGTMRSFLATFDGIRPDFAAEVGSGPRESLVTIAPEFVIPYLSFVKDNLPVFQAYIERLHVMRTDLVFQRLYQDVIDPVLARFGVPERERRYRALFYLTGIAAIVQEWARNGCEDDVELVARLICGCVLPSGAEAVAARAGGE